MNDILEPIYPELTHAPQVPFSQMTDDQVEYELLDHLVWARLYQSELITRSGVLGGSDTDNRILQRIKGIITLVKEE